MKTFVLAVLVLASAEAAHAQGTINFVNVNAGAGINAPVYESDGVTKCSGPQFMAELLAGPSLDSLASVAMTGFLTGNGAGYYVGGSVTVPGVAGGATAWVQVDVWNTASGPTFAQARSSGLPNSWWQSQTFTVTTGNPYSPGAPTTPAALTGLGNSPGYLNSVPEPTVLALLALGAASLLRRR